MRSHRRLANDRIHPSDTFGVTKVADFSWTYFSPDALPWADGAIRYLSHDTTGKNWTAEQLAEWRNAGKSCGFVWEDSADRATDGYDAGKADAIEANRQADVLTVPSTVVIYYAVDSNAVTPSDVAEYFRGTRDAGGRARGCYGSKKVVEAMLSLGYVTKGWMVETWWDAEPQPLDNPNAHLVQLANSRTTNGADDNMVLKADWGGWGAGSPPGPAPLPLIDGLDHQHPTFARRVSDFCRATGCTVYNGARTTAEQKRLWDGWVARLPGFNPANPPGASFHEFGADLLGGPYACAVDLSAPGNDFTEAHNRAAEFGLCFAVFDANGGEPWHVQVSEVPETARVAGAEDRIPALPTSSEEDDMSFNVTIRPGERSLFAVPIIGGGGGVTGVTWGAVTITAPDPGDGTGATITLAHVWPSERKIDGVLGKPFSGLVNVQLQPGDQAVEILNDHKSASRVDVLVESGK